jgi:hypothetical protein
MNSHGGKFVHVACDHVNYSIFTGIIAEINIAPSTCWGEGVCRILKGGGTLRLGFKNQAKSKDKQ